MIQQKNVKTPQFEGTNVSTLMNVKSSILLDLGIADTISETDVKVFLDPYRIYFHNKELAEKINGYFQNLKETKNDVMPLEFLGTGYAVNKEHKYAPSVPNYLFSQAFSIFELRNVKNIGLARTSDVIGNLLLKHLYSYTNEKIKELSMIYHFEVITEEMNYYNYEKNCYEKMEVTSVFDLDENGKKHIRILVPLKFLTVRHAIDGDEKFRNIFFSEKTFYELVEVRPEQESEIMSYYLAYSQAPNKPERNKLKEEILTKYPEIEDVFSRTLCTNNSYHDYITEKVLGTIKVDNLKLMA